MPEEIIEDNAIAEMQAEFERNELQAFLDDGEERADPEPSEEPAPESKAPKGEPASTASEKAGDRRGSDVVIARLEEIDPQLAENYRDQLANNTRLSQKLQEVERNLPNVVEEAVKAAMAEEQPEEDDEFTPEQIASAKERARKMGLVLAEDLEQKEKLTTRQTYLKEAKAQALEEFGEAFGVATEEGGIQITEEANEVMTKELQRLQQYGTPTLRDLYILANHQALIEKAKATGIEQGRAEKAERVDNLMRAETETGTSSAEPMPNLRGKPGTASDSLQAVMKRAGQAAMKQLGLNGSA